MNITVRVNGKDRQLDVDPEMPLLWALRDVLGLTGTKYGCGEGECGACTIIVDGRSVNSCLLFALDCDGRELTTIEGLAGNKHTEALRQSFVSHGAVQCGFCTPGMVMAAVSLIEEGGATSEAAIREGLEGNLCRCTGYHNIVRAVAAAAGAAS